MDGGLPLVPDDSVEANFLRQQQLKDFPANFRRAAEIVGRVLQGGKPDHIPVEQASAVELVLNLKTAKALGIEINQSMRTRIDRAIE